MAFLSGAGFVIDKSRHNDNRLIIRILTNSDEVVSAVLFVRHKGKASPNFLDHIQFQLVEKPNQEFKYLKEYSCVESFVPIKGRESKIDYYFFLAEVLRTIGRRIEVERGLYHLVEDVFNQFKGELSPDLLIYFLLNLLDVFGILPTQVEEVEFLDFREGNFSNSVPFHQDYCRADLFLKSYNLLNEKQLDSAFLNAQQRLELIHYFLRYFEIQKGIKLTLNSIEILREIR